MCQYYLILIVFIHGVYANTICSNDTVISLDCEPDQILRIEDVSLGNHNCENIKYNYDTSDSENCISNITEIIEKNCANQHTCEINTLLPEFENICSESNRTILANYSCEGSNTVQEKTTIATIQPRNFDGTTTEPNSKPKYGCGLNTCRVYCAPGCQRTCFNTYISQCTEPCIPFGCRCREGYYRDPLNLENCLKYEHCPQMGNNTNEVYSPNAAGCQKACGSSQKYVDTCLEICEQYGTCEAGYVCKEGFQRESCFLNIFKRQFNCVKLCHSYYWCV